MKKELIGINQNREMEIFSAYSELCEQLNQLQVFYQSLFGDFDKKDLVNFAKSNDAKDWLSRRYAAFRKNDFAEGTDVHSMLIHGHIQLPERFEYCLTEHKKIKNSIEKIKENSFITPLIRLLNKKEFAVSEEMCTAISEHCSVYTETQEQAQVLESFRKIATEFNKLSALGILSINKHGLNSLSKLRQFFEVDNMLPDPVVVSRFAFNHTGKYRLQNRLKDGRPHSDLFKIEGE